MWLYEHALPYMSKTTYGDKSPHIHDAYLSVCQKSMSDASTEIRKQLQENFDSKALSDIDVSLDGSWQHRGYASLNGVVTAISQESGKRIDFEVLSKNCKACKVWERNKDTQREEYERFKVDHQCPINHAGSA